MLLRRALADGKIPSHGSSRYFRSIPYHHTTRAFSPFVGENLVGCKTLLNAAARVVFVGCGSAVKLHANREIKRKMGVKYGVHFGWISREFCETNNK